MNQKIFCTKCGILLAKGGSGIVRLIREKVYGDRPVQEETPTEFNDGLFCSVCTKKRRAEK